MMKAIKYLLVLILMLAMTMPAMAHNGKGPGGKGGGKGEEEETTPDIPDTGELYGDLYVILRDEDGVPIFDEHLCIQPISSVTASTDIETSDGTMTIYAFEGEPFSLAYYTDTAGDLVECELTEAMATWVQTVDFGRLNLGRAPDSVMAHAFDEAIKKMNTATAMYLDPAGRLVLTLPDEENPGLYVDKTIDAPAENLALYIAMMTEGDWVTEDTTPIVHGGLPTDVGPPEGDGPSAEPRPVLNADAISLLTALGFEHLGIPFDSEYSGEEGYIRVGAGDLNDQELLLAASLLAAAADKTGSITLDKVVYINFIYGINQLGTLDDGVEEGRRYFDFGAYDYARGTTYSNRGSVECGVDENGYPVGLVKVLQPEADTDNNLATDHFITQCMDILGYVPGSDPAYNAVRFTDMTEEYITDWVLAEDDDGNLFPDGTLTTQNFTSNVRGFAQAADDALQVIEYIHNYKVPEVLYP